jgi:serine protease SohB
MDLLQSYGMFLLKTVTVLLSSLIVIAAFFSQSRKSPQTLETRSFNEDLKIKIQAIKKKFKWKASKKEKKQTLNQLPRAFILDFCGDIRATQAQQLREEITGIINLHQKGDVVMIRLESPGGAVNGYGFAASQLERLRQRQINLEVCIDQVAASGGYLMACVANKIYASPFAIVGSIGVIAQLPNFNKFLKKHNIDFEQVTAGPYKRTLTVFGENTKEGRQKFAEELGLIHDKFKSHVLNYRPQLNMDKVATGEHWLAKDAIDMGLVDALSTSDDWILEKLKTHHIIHIKQTRSQSFIEKILKPASAELSQLLHQKNIY